MPFSVYFLQESLLCSCMLVKGIVIKLFVCRYKVGVMSTSGGYNMCGEEKKHRKTWLHCSPLTFEFVRSKGLKCSSQKTDFLFSLV